MEGFQTPSWLLHKVTQRMLWAIHTNMPQPWPGTSHGTPRTLPPRPRQGGGTTDLEAYWPSCSHLLSNTEHLRWTWECHRNGLLKYANHNRVYTRASFKIYGRAQTYGHRGRKGGWEELGDWGWRVFTIYTLTYTTPHHLMGNRWGESERLYLSGLQHHCRWWLQPWN